ncbi:MAG TPA: hypothetical protein VNK95_07185 [Caldilineaceae bacterium]|nr:hypothetical protein [Caldilineaceae bacterium]
MSLLLVALFATAAIRSAWLSDDAYITLRSVDNLIHGYGPVWNVGERVQSYTHPLWMLILAAGRLVTGEYYYTTLALSLLLSTVAVWLVVQRLATRPASAWFAAAALILSRSFVDYSTSGLENPLAHLLLAAFLVVLLRRLPSPGRLFSLSLLAALGVLTRHDLILVYGPLLLYAWGQTPGRRAWQTLLLGFLPVLLWELFSLVYYGFPFPNTAYAKLNTGIERSELVRQGSLYLLHTFVFDPAAAATVMAGLAAAVLARRPVYRWLAAGVALYLVYILVIGGDFMAGRFITVPLLAALAIWIGQMDALPARLRLAAAAPILLAALLALRPATMALPPDEQTLAPQNGISDERAAYTSRHGLATATRLNRLVDEGRVQGTAEPQLASDCGGIGIRAFRAGRFTYLVDACGLSDPLLARLPAFYTPDWRIGHFRRIIPTGYLGTLRTQENRLADPGLAAYYEKLRLIVRGPLWSRERLRAIWQLNTRSASEWVDVEHYRYPDAPVFAAGELARAASNAAGEAGRSFPVAGFYVAFDEPSRARYLLLGVACDSFYMTYARSGGEAGAWQERRIWRQTVNSPALMMGDEPLVVVEPPPAAVEAGFDRVHLIPRLCEEQSLAFVEPVAGLDAPLTLEQMAELYYFFYYRQVGPRRETMLAGLLERMGQAEPASWQALPLLKQMALLAMPVPALHRLAASRLPPPATLASAAGEPLLQVYGLALDQTREGIELDLYLEALALPLGALYLAPAAGADGPRYDVMPEEGWQPGLVQKVSVDVPVEVVIDAATSAANAPSALPALELCAGASTAEQPARFLPIDGPCISLAELHGGE